MSDDELRRLAEQGDPVAASLLSAPPSHEPVPDDELAAIEDARAQIVRGDARVMTAGAVAAWLDEQRRRGTFAAE